MKKESGPWSGISAASSPRAGRCDRSASFISPQRFLFCLSIVMFLNLQLKINPLKTNNHYQLVKTLLRDFTFREMLDNKKCFFLLFHKSDTVERVSASLWSLALLQCCCFKYWAGNLRQRFWFCVTSQRADIHIWSSQADSTYTPAAQTCCLSEMLWINWNVWFKTELFFILNSVHLCKTPV